MDSRFLELLPILIYNFIYLTGSVGWNQKLVCKIKNRTGITHRIKKKEIWPETRKVIRSKAMASRKGGSGGGGEGVRSLELELEKMSVEQLRAFKEQTDMEVNLLHDSLNNIRTATSRLDIASAALHDLSLRPQGWFLSLFFISSS